MATPDPVCEGIAGTALYTSAGGGAGGADGDGGDDEAGDRVMTLERSEAEYVKLKPLSVDEAYSSFKAAVAGPPQIVVQLRKRNGAVQLFLDGHHSEGTDHRLYWHAGLHHDEETMQRILSPLAIVCALEDGQRPLRSVRVGLWQTLVDAAGTAVHDPVLLSERILYPHRVSDVRSYATLAPYPIPYQAMPVVRIFDDREKRMKEAELKVKYAKGVMQNLYKTLKRSQNLDSGAGLNEVLNNVIALGDTGIESIQNILFYTAAAAGILYVGPQKSAFFKSIMDALTTKRLDDLFDPALATTIAGDYIWTMLTNPKPPPPQRVSFNLRELAKVLETLVALRSSRDDSGGGGGGGNGGNEGKAGKAAFILPLLGRDESRERLRTTAAQSAFGHSEMLFWDWLTSEKAANRESKFGLLDSDDLLYESKPQTALHITIDADNSFECASNDATSARHEIRCAREDAYYLGSASVGALDDLRRIQKSLRRLVTILSSNDALLNSLLYWAVFRPTEMIAGFAQTAAQKTLNPGGALSKQAIRTAMSKLLGDEATSFEQFEQANRRDLDRARSAIGQLTECFLMEAGSGWKLKERMERAIESKGQPKARPERPIAWTRHLPQRVGVSHFSYLFGVGQQFSMQHVDVETLTSIVREHTGYHDASQVLSATLKAGERYLRRRVPHWEARSDTRVLLKVECVSINKDNAPPHREGDACFSTLALTTPIDIQFAGAVSRFTEESLRCIRFVVKRAQQKCDKSILEALGLEHKSEDLFACQVFGDLWASELIALHQRSDPTREQLQMLEQASSRATARLRALGNHLLSVFTVREQADVGDGSEDDVAPEVSDIAFHATLAGRDAAHLLARLLFARDDFEVRAVMTPVVRSAAAAAVRVSGVFERAVPARLPHEPLASLFSDRADCVAAFLRATELLPYDDVPARRAMVAAYASARLMSDEESAMYASALAEAPLQEWNDERIESAADLLVAMRFRTASLRIDHDVLGLVDDMENIQIDGLATKLTRTGKEGVAFYVPFGFGDARPAPTLPPCSVPMFGSVPVFGWHLDYVFGLFDLVVMRPEYDNANVADPNPNNDALRVRLEPSLRCLERVPFQANEESAAHPNVVHVLPDELPSRFKARFLASVSRSRKGQLPPFNYDYETTVSALAHAHRCDAGAMEMAHEVSSIGWNAERVLQSIVAALACANALDGSIDEMTIGIELVLPSFADYADSWYKRRVQARTDGPQRALDRAKLKHSNAKLLATYVQMLKQTIEQLEQREQALQNTPAGPTVLQQELQDVRGALPALQWWLDNRLGGDQAQQIADDDVAETEQAMQEAERELQAAKEELTLDADEAVQRAKRVLLGAVGIGMAMASALVFPIRLQLRRLSVASGDARGLFPVGDGPYPGVAKRFSKCDAVRLSEACLIISQLL